MDENRFGDRLAAGWRHGRFVCVGLDPDEEQVRATVGWGAPAERILAFTTAVVDATSDLVLAYKPNAAFYEQFGPPGMEALQATIAHVHAVVPHAVVILDAKRGDVGHTNGAYARALYDVYDADAVTVQPYLGAGPLAAFLDRIDRGVIVLCRTSNPGAGELQDLVVGDRPLYQEIAHRAQRRWNEHGNCGLLVGATYPDEIARVRREAPTLPLLVAGVGRQQGALAASVRAAATAGGGVIVSASRSITHVAVGPGFADHARQATLQLHVAVGDAMGTRDDGSDDRRSAPAGA